MSNKKFAAELLHNITVMQNEKYDIREIVREIAAELDVFAAQSDALGAILEALGMEYTASEFLDAIADDLATARERGEWEHVASIENGLRRCVDHECSALVGGKPDRNIFENFRPVSDVWIVFQDPGDDEHLLAWPAASMCVERDGSVAYMVTDSDHVAVVFHGGARVKWTACTSPQMAALTDELRIAPLVPRLSWMRPYANDPTGWPSDTGADENAPEDLDRLRGIFNDDGNDNGAQGYFDPFRCTDDDDNDVPY